MSDQPMQGVTTRSLDTSQDIERSGAISTRSGLARMYADQFRADRNLMRRGAVTRTPTIIPDVPAPSDDVTQEQETTSPGSFGDVIDATGGIRGGSQGANQVINPGGGGGIGYQFPGSGDDRNRNAGYDPNPGMQHIDPIDDSPLPPVEYQDRESDGGCAIIVNNTTGQVMKSPGCEPGETAMPPLPSNAVESEDGKYYYRVNTVGNIRNFQGYVRETNQPVTGASMGLNADNKRVCRSLLDCHWNNAGWFTRHFGIEFTR